MTERHFSGGCYAALRRHYLMTERHFSGGRYAALRRHYLMTERPFLRKQEDRIQEEIGFGDLKLT